MAFFTTNPYIAENFLNPQTRGIKPVLPGAGPLSSTPNINPYQMAPNQVQSQTNWGAPTGMMNPNQTWQDTPFIGQYDYRLPWYQQGNAFVGGTPGFDMRGDYSSPVQPQQPTYSSGGGDDSFPPDATMPTGPGITLGEGYNPLLGFGIGMLNPFVGLGYTALTGGFNQGAPTIFDGIGDLFGDGTPQTPATPSLEQSRYPNYYTDNGVLVVDKSTGYGAPSLIQDGGRVQGPLPAPSPLDQRMYGPYGNLNPYMNDAALETGQTSSPLDMSLGTTDSSFTSDGNGGVSFTSEETGTVTGTDYGGGSYGFDSGASGAYGGAGEEVGYESPDGGDSGGDSGGGGGSYIATAATQALGEEGLKVFEDWRDYMFTALPTFTSSFGRYRATAPKIVAEIDKKHNSKNIYSWIWDMHLKPIFDMISKDKDSEKALKDYKIMVRELNNKFLKREK